MTSLYQGKICVPISELLLSKCNKNAVFFFKITQNKVKVLFFLKKAPFRYAMFGGCPYSSNETLGKAYSNQLRSCNPKNRKKVHEKKTLLHSKL